MFPLACLPHPLDLSPFNLPSPTPLRTSILSPQPQHNHFLISLRDLPYPPQQTKERHLNSLKTTSIPPPVQSLPLQWNQRLSNLLRTELLERGRRGRPLRTLA